MKICCFTGHRSIKAAERARLVSRVDSLLCALYEEGYREFRTGGARGFDTLVALRVLFFQKSHPDCRLSLKLPCREQTKGWGEGERIVFEDILARADEVQYLSEAYTPDCMHARNRALVNGADLCVAYLTENRGGTLYTASYALKNGVEFRNLADE